MQCNFDYCVYNESCKCLLNEIQINSLGMCEDCIVVSISDMELTGLKKVQMEALKRN